MDPHYGHWSWKSFDFLGHETFIFCRHPNSYILLMYLVEVVSQTIMSLKFLGYQWFQIDIHRSCNFTQYGYSNIQQGLWGQHGAHLGRVSPRWAPYWPHEPCFQGNIIFAALQELIHWGLGPLLLTWFKFNPNMDYKVWDEITYRFPVQFGNGWIISSQTLLGMWFLIHVGIKVIIGTGNGLFPVCT